MVQLVSASEQSAPVGCDEPAIIPTRTITPSQIDPDALKVVRRLQRFGHAAYLVGGCVRDLLLKRTPKDFDVVTSARPHEVRKLFRNCRLIGRRFRLAHIHFRGKIVETATFRAEAGHQDGGDLLIRSDNVFGSEREDAYRRDFTINALFYDPVKRALIDYVGGLEDLVERTLRFIGDPGIRVQEDPVRILRAIKFAARLDFDVEAESWRAVVGFRQEIAKAAPARLMEEIVRMLRGGAAEASYRLLWEAGVIHVLLPDVARYLARCLERGEERDPGAGLWAYLRAVDRSDRELLTNAVLLSALLMHSVCDAAAGDPTEYDLQPSSAATGEVAKELLRRLVDRVRLPKREAERVQQLLSSQKRLIQLRRNMPLPKALMRRIYFPEALDLFEIGVRATKRGRRTLSRLRHAYRRTTQARNSAGERHKGANDGQGAPKSKAAKAGSGSGKRGRSSARRRRRGKPAKTAAS